jgi:hypothetical protein
MNTLKEDRTMAELAIVSVNAPTNVRTATAFTVTVSVIAEQEAFDQGAAYTLQLYVFGAKAAPGGVAGFLGGAPSVQSGSLQTAPWDTINDTIPFPLTAGPAPDLYTVTAVLFLGPGKVFQSLLSAPNPIVVKP